MREEWKTPAEIWEENGHEVTNVEQGGHSQYFLVGIVGKYNKAIMSGSEGTILEFEADDRNWKVYKKKKVLKHLYIYKLPNMEDERVYNVLYPNEYEAKKGITASTPDKGDAEILGTYGPGIEV